MNTTSWTKKYHGTSGKHQENLILVEINSVGTQVAEWLIGTYEEEGKAATLRPHLATLLTTGEESPPLTEADVEKIKQAFNH